MGDSETNREVTVIFRYDKKNKEVFAIMPYEIADTAFNCTTYQHVGQHSAGNYSWMTHSSRLAKESEYKDLKKELESIGYNLKVQSKRDYNKFLQSIDKF